VKKYNSYRKKIATAEAKENSGKQAGQYFDEPGLHYAHQIYMNRDLMPETGFVIESRLLAGYSSKEIAKRFGTIPEVIDWYERLFFNVRDRMECTDWLLTRVLTPALCAVPVAYAESPMNPSNQFSIPYYDATLKYFSFFGGKVMCEFMLHGDRIGVQPSGYDNLLSYMEEDFKHKYYRRALAAVQTFEINKYNVTEIFSTFTAIMSLRAASDDLEKAQSGFHKNVSQMLLDMPWAVGDTGADNFAETSVAAYDESSAELRASELLELTGGATDEALKHLQSLKFPPSMEEKEAAAAADKDAA